VELAQGVAPELKPQYRKKKKKKERKGKNRHNKRKSGGPLSRWLRSNDLCSKEFISFKSKQQENLDSLCRRGYVMIDLTESLNILCMHLCQFSSLIVYMKGDQ
jgi:hypothetical protein